MRVGFDLDGVGYIFGLSVRDYLKTIGITVEEPTDKFCTNWDFYEFWGMTREEFAKHCDAGVDAGIIFGAGDHLTRPSFFDAIKRVKGMGHEVIVITHRFQGTPGNAEKNTELWLAPVRDYIDEIHFSADKTKPRTDMFVEDSLPNYDSLVDAGINAYLINRPWNWVEGGDARNRINDIEEYADAVEEATVRGFTDLTLA